MDTKKVISCLEAVYKLSRLPSSAQILGPNSFQVTYAQHEPREGKAFRFTQLYTPDPAGQILNEKVLADQLSPSRNYRLVVREGEKKEQNFFELWNKQRIIAVKDLKAEHRQVLIDDQFGQVSWSSDERSILYIAEKKRAEEVSIWDSEAGSKNLYRENLGENLAHVSDPGLFVFHWEEKKVEAVPVPPDVLPAFPAFHPRESEFAFIGYKKHSYALGLRYMLNREAQLFKSRLGGEPLPLELPQGFISLLNPKFSSDGKLFVTGVPHTVAHSTCYSLISVDWTTLQTSTVIPLYATSQPHFSGLYGFHDSLSRSGWLTNDKYIFETAHRTSSSLFTVDLQGEVKELLLPIEKPYSASLLDIYNGDALIKVSTFTKLPSIYRYSSASHNLLLVESNVPEPHTQEEQSILDTLARVRTQTITHRNTDIDSTLYSTSQDAPLIVLIHGGPHALSTADYIPSRVALLLQGYNILNVNYRGSVGFGHSQVETLLGNAGSMDLDDVLHSIEVASEVVSTSKIVSYGGSHGGFLSAHLAATGKVAASVVINGVIDIASMCYNTDITDWCFAEGLNSSIKYPMTGDQAKHLYSQSPISRAAGVNCPTLIAVGNSDLRVPAFNSMEWYRVLKGLGKPVTMLSFPQDGHAIETPTSGYEFTAYALSWLGSVLSIPSGTN